MYEADVDREEIHDKLQLLIEHMHSASVDNQQMAILVLTVIAKINAQVSVGVDSDRSLSQ